MLVCCWPREPCFFLRRPHKCNNQTQTVRHFNHPHVRFTPRNLEVFLRFSVSQTCFFLISLFFHSKTKENEDSESACASPEARSENRRPTDFLKPTHKLGSTKIQDSQLETNREIVSSAKQDLHNSSFQLAKIWFEGQFRQISVESGVSHEVLASVSSWPRWPLATDTFSISDLS